MKGEEGEFDMNATQSEEKAIQNHGGLSEESYEEIDQLTIEPLQDDGLISYDDLFDAARALVECASAFSQTVCSCESFTAGLFCATIGSVPGASRVLRGGLVTYQTPLKTLLADVSPALIEEFGVVSAPCAAVMAYHTRQKLQADYCVSFTGNAGPDAMEGKPAGLIYCGLSGPRKTVVFKAHLQRERNGLRKLAVRSMLVTLRQMMEDDLLDAAGQKQDEQA